MMLHVIIKPYKSYTGVKSDTFLAFSEELQKQLVEQVELRKKLEREFQHLKGRTKWLWCVSSFVWRLNPVLVGHR